MKVYRHVQGKLMSIFHCIQETKDEIEQLHLMSNFSTCMAYTKLKSILPPTVILHQHHNKIQIGLFQLNTSLMNSTDDVYKDAALYASDLHKLNFGPNRKLDVSKFKIYFRAMDTVVEIGGNGAHEKQHSQVSFILTTN